jgi:hypothetical protein
MGIEITAPGAVLFRHGVAALDDEEWAPFAA